MRGEIVKEGLGEGSISPRKSKVNELHAFHITYKVGKERIKKGGMLRFEFPYAFSAPQILFPDSKGYVKAETSNKNVRFSLEVLSTGYEWNHPLLKKDHFYYVTRYGRHVLVKVEEGEFKKGDIVTLLYGPYYHLEPLVRTPHFSGNFEFTIAVKPDLDTEAPFSGFYLIPKSPSVKVEGNKAEKFTQIEVKGKEINGRSKVSMKTTDYHLYWGDLHGHTLLSDGLGDTEEYYQYGKEQACLDFCAISDHAQYMNEKDWEDIKKATEKFYKPNEFVTILGHEYSSGRDHAHGDLNIYYPHLDAPLIQPYDIYRSPSSCTHLNDVIEQVKCRRGMIIFHQHARGNRVYDPDVVRLIEIYSIWGSAEYPGNPYPLLHEKSSGVDYHGHTAQDYLSRGWKLGFTGGSDCHAGHPGESNWMRIAKGYHNGLTGVWAENLTREKIWEALYLRRCYGTTGARIILNFTLNGKHMGSEIRDAEERKIKIEVHATAEIETIEIVKNNKTIHTYQTKKIDEEIKYTDKSKRDGKIDYYYIRIRQKDGEMAWSSPIWVSKQSGANLSG